MKQVVLYFPSGDVLFEFLLLEKIAGVDVCSQESSLRGLLTQKQIDVACGGYGASLFPNPQHFYW